MDSTRLRVLYVDDTESQRYAVSRMLSSGCDVSQASTGEEGIALAAKLNPDVIILDVKLPDINGLDVCRRLKSEAGTKEIPILQISASFTSPEHKATALDSGADGYLTTPLNSTELMATMRARPYSQSSRRGRAAISKHARSFRQRHGCDGDLGRKR